MLKKDEIRKNHIELRKGVIWGGQKNSFTTFSRENKVFKLLLKRSSKIRS